MNLGKYTQKTYSTLSTYYKDYKAIKTRDKKTDKAIELGTFGACGLTLFNWGLGGTFPSSITIIFAIVTIMGCFSLAMYFSNQYYNKKIEQLTQQLESELAQTLATPEDYFSLIYELEQLNKHHDSEFLFNTIQYYKELVNEYGKIEIDQLLSIVDIIKETKNETYQQEHKKQSKFSYEHFVKSFHKQDEKFNQEHNKEIEIGATIEDKPIKKHL